MTEQHFLKLLDFKFRLRRRCHLAHGQDRETLIAVIAHLETLLDGEPRRERYLMSRAMSAGDLVG